jgi:hypothetical protein
MSRTCDECDAELTPERDKSRGRYRDRCLPCLVADARAADTRHVVTCTADDCIVCRDYAAEFTSQ